MFRSSCLRPLARSLMPRHSFDRPAAATCRQTPAARAPRRSLGQRRGEILRGLFPMLASWLETDAERLRRREVEQYLMRASDLLDLEARLRRLERDEHVSAIH
jgi:hypothetical protein